MILRPIILSQSLAVFLSFLIMGVPAAGGPDLVTFGFQRFDERFHADNEFMRIESFKKSQRAYAQLMHALVGQPKRD